MGWDPAFTFRDCPWCGLRDAQMVVLANELWVARPNASPRFYGAIACPRCAGVTVVEVNEPNAFSAKIVRVYPDTAADVNVNYLPGDVSQYYRDAIRVLEAGVPDAAAVQLRRTLEAAAAHFGIDKGPLVNRIRQLITKGLITVDFGRVLDHIREVGNVGAHASEQRIDEATAARALRFTTQVLRNLFEIPAELGLLGQTPTGQTQALVTDLDGG